MTKVALAGGTAGVGKAIADALLSRGHDFVLLTRSKISDPHCVIVDYSKIDDLVSILETHNIHTVISAIAISDEASGQAQMNLIEAASRAAPTMRFMPSEFGAHYKPENIHLVFPSYVWKFKAAELLEKTDLEFTQISVGIFLDYFAGSVIPTHLAFVAPTLLDWEHKAAVIPGDGTAKFVMTHTSDAARFAVAALDLPCWERRYTVVGDRLSMNEAVATAEKVTGVKFEVAHDSLEDLENGKVTLNPTFQAMMEGADKATLEATTVMLAKSSKLVVEGHLDLNPDIALNKLFPDIPVLTLRRVAELWRDVRLGT